MLFNAESYTGEFINKTMNHLYIAPTKELKNIVAHYTITFPNPKSDIKEGSVLNLIPDVSGCFVFKMFDKLSIKVWGPTTKVVVVDNDLKEGQCRFFVEFLPGGLFQVLGMNINPLLDKKIELEELQASLYHEINQQVLKMNSFDELVQLMNDILVRETRKNKIDQDIYYWIEYLQKNNRISLQEVAAKLDISERQLNRYFNRYIGMGFKKYSKLVNINYLIKELVDKELIDLTYDYDYFDQAHFNHTFKEICNITPTRYLENLSDFYNELYKF